MVNLSYIAANALVPDHLLHYVSSVSGLKSSLCGDGVLHFLDDIGVLIAYPLPDPLNPGKINSMVEEALAAKKLKQLTVLSGIVPPAIPKHAQIKKDHYWQLALPISAKSQKLRNMLTRSTRDLRIVRETWTDEHSSLRDEFCKNKHLDDATCYIYKNLPKYLASSPLAVLYCARDKNDNLAGLAIADYSALGTAFYMFAMRSPNAPPGSADLLLDSIVTEAGEKGHVRLNLGLGIDRGIEFFKKKWGAEPWLPCIEASWQIKKNGFLSRLFGR